MFSKMVCAAMVAGCVMMGAAGAQAQSQSFGGPEEKMMMTAFVNLTVAETWDKECNRGKITSKTDRGHGANFAGGKEKLTSELSARLGQTTKGDVSLIVQQISADVTAKATKIFKGINGCFGDDARHGEKMMDIISKTEPNFLMKTLGGHIDAKAADERAGR